MYLYRSIRCLLRNKRIYYNTAQKSTDNLPHFILQTENHQSSRLNTVLEWKQIVCMTVACV